MKALGIDPGIAIMGYGLVEETKDSTKAVEFGCIRTSKTLSPPERLLNIHTELEGIIKKLKPDVIAIERLFFTSNSKTAFSVGEARGVALLCAAQNGLSAWEYTPLQVKLALTGYGKADKKQIQHMVKNLLKLKDIPRPDDAADALAIAICHINSYNLLRR